MTPPTESGGSRVSGNENRDRLPIVDAALQSDRTRMEEVVRATPAGDPNRELYAAILESGRAQEAGGEALRAALKALSGFLEKPPADLELFQVLLMRLVALGCRSGSIGEAARALKLLEQLGGDARPRPDMAAAILYCRSLVLLNRGEAAPAREAIERALEILGPGTDRQRCVYKSLHVETAMHLGDWRAAERGWAEIEKAPFDRVVSIPWAYVHARVLTSAGRHAEALAVLDAAPAPATAFEKRWILVQTRTDLIRRSADLMAAWRPLAKDFDIFLGLEAATDRGLAGIDKDAGVDDCIEAVRVAREQRYGINGNFLVDHDWGEDDFRELWEFVAKYNLQRAGFTILTPLPGTDFYREKATTMADQPWSNFDMHHLLWEPRIGAARFLELYAETWRRSILNTSGEKSIFDWMRQVRPSQIPYIVRVLWRTQRMMKPAAYLREHEESRIVRQGLPRARQPSEIFS